MFSYAEANHLSTIDQHSEEIQRNLYHWHKKPVLRIIYQAFYKLIAENLTTRSGPVVVELGSGIGNIKDVIPNCIRTDLFPNPWIDRVENSYSLSFPDKSVSDLILFDVFHHLRFPGTALNEFHRVLVPSGRVIIFDPCMSILGILIYGLLHKEPLGLRRPIRWFAPSHLSANDIDYYAAQANATRVFLRREFADLLYHWEVIKTRRLSAISYVASGGYSKPQLYPDCAFGLMRFADSICDIAPSLCATRLLVVLRKKTKAEADAPDCVQYASRACSSG